MKITDLRNAMRDEPLRQPNESRSDWQARLVAVAEQRVREWGLTQAIVRSWLWSLARDVTADIIKRPGAAPRVAAGQTAIWADMEPVAGREAMRTYVRQNAGRVARSALFVAIVGKLDAAYGEDVAALGSHPSLINAAIHADCTDEEISALREMAR